MRPKAGSELPRMWLGFELISLWSWGLHCSPWNPSSELRLHRAEKMFIFRFLQSWGRSCSYSGCVCGCVCVCEQAQTGWALYWFIGVRKPGVPFFSPAAILDKSCNFSLWSFLTCNLKVIPPCTVMFWEVACDNILKFPNSRSQRSLKHVGTYFTGRGHMNLEFGNPKNQGIKETWRSFFLLGFQVKSKHVVLTTVFTSIWKTLCYRKN